ncbi:MAG: PTS sugar transporter subunit IIB [Treponema sp.]|nr:PTS sugar transporter subunit IIB [Treponema sp.]
MNILAVCGLGIGSSIMLKINVGKVLDELGVRGYQLNVADIGTAKSIPFDMVVTSVELADVLKKGTPPEKHFRILSINNFISKDEMRTKVSECLKQLGEI